MKGIYTSAILIIIFIIPISILIAKGGDMVIQDGSRVSFDYTLTVDDKVIDSSGERGPMQYTHGKGQIIRGLERKLEGLGLGDEKIIEVLPEEAYGMVDSQAFKEIERSYLPSDKEPKVNMFLNVQTTDGRTFPARIAEIKKDTVMLDLNHPLAGKTLYFQVKIVSIE